MGGALTERGRRIAAFFDEEAVRYDSSYDRRCGRVVRARLAVVLRFLGAGPGDVLDAGMGGGRLCVELERRGWTVSGVDSSEQMVALARERLAHAGERLQQARVEALPFPDDSFDAVVASGVLEYVDDLATALGEVHRTLRPGARAVLTFPNFGSVPACWRGRILCPAARLAKGLVPIGRPIPFRSRHQLPRRRFEDAVAAAGLRVEAVEVVGVRGPARVLARRIEGPPSLLGALLGLQFVLEARKG